MVSRNCWITTLAGKSGVQKIFNSAQWYPGRSYDILCHKFTRYHCEIDILCSPYQAMSSRTKTELLEIALNLSFSCGWLLNGVISVSHLRKMMTNNSELPLVRTIPMKANSRFDVAVYGMWSEAFLLCSINQDKMRLNSRAVNTAAAREATKCVKQVFKLSQYVDVGAGNLERLSRIPHN